MIKKQIIYIFAVLTVCSISYADIGDSCEVRYNGQAGKCVISCPIVEQEAKVGIDPTICEYYHRVVPVVCCPIGHLTDQETNRFNKPDIVHYEPEVDRFNTADPDPLIFPGDIEESNDNLRISEQKCEEYGKLFSEVVQALPLVTHIEPISLSIEKCDYNSVPLIVGGEPASAAEFPFMAAIGFQTDDQKWRCGGTLISDRFVLTAAHCTSTRDAGAPTVVRLGDLDLSTSHDGSQHHDYDIENIILHPGYRFPLKYHDLALIKTKQTVEFTKFIRPACLYTEKFIEQPSGVATGWGKTDFAAEISDRLMKVTLNIYHNSECTKIYHKSKDLPRGVVSNMLCAGDLRGGKDTCQGDSGGPLLITKAGNQCKFYVIGVTSFGKSCGQVNTTAVYTKVSSYVDWIEKTIW
ncbi:serine protease snake-like [Anoplophora glabripennis]|uniref:serine protease snake-like n=1 Tax=Anoplophora glabripennis TaxID=217634 RepID=UPI000875636A|nr:serine protease snake-like [Anoplophora glabripennis]